VTPEDRAALRAAMYEQPDEVEELEENPLADDSEERQTVQIEAVGKFVTIRVDGQRITLPSTSYVNALEKTNTEQAREILRLKAAVKLVRALVNQHSNEFNEVNRELERKVNLRDRP
jgi:hypothetical protein